MGQQLTRISMSGSVTDFFSSSGTGTGAAMADRPKNTERIVMTAEERMMGDGGVRSLAGRSASLVRTDHGKVIRKK
jgi:hypothetical protein